MDGVIALGESLMVAAFKEGLGCDVPTPFPRMTYADAMSRFGCDKPDTRYGMELQDISVLVSRPTFSLYSTQADESKAANTGCKLFTDAVTCGGVVKLIRVPRGSRLPNSALKPRGGAYLMTD